MEDLWEEGTWHKSWVPLGRAEQRWSQYAVPCESTDIDTRELLTDGCRQKPIFPPTRSRSLSVSPNAFSYGAPQCLPRDSVTSPHTLSKVGGFLGKQFGWGFPLLSSFPPLIPREVGLRVGVAPSLKGLLRMGRRGNTNRPSPGDQGLWEAWEVSCLEGHGCTVYPQWRTAFTWTTMQ